MEKYKKLPEPFKTDWIKALRSGEYNQTNGQLAVIHDDKTVGYCCLGVAAKICGYEDKEIERFGVHDSQTHTKIPTELLNDHELQWKLVHFNDIDHKTFNEIADWIEINL